jgi:hypothetical protein
MKKDAGKTDAGFLERIFGAVTGTEVRPGR